MQKKPIKRVFLGGTCNESTWREELIPKLKIDYFNPVVDNWTDEAYQNELRERIECCFVLYVITPKMHGVYSIAEVVDDSNKKPERTLFCFLESELKKEENEEIRRTNFPKAFIDDKKIYFSTAQKKSLIAVGNMVQRNGGKWLKSLDEVVKFLNKYSDDKEKI